MCDSGCRFNGNVEMDCHACMLNLNLDGVAAEQAYKRGDLRVINSTFPEDNDEGNLVEWTRKC